MRKGIVVLGAVIALSGVGQAQGAADTIQAAADALGLLRGFTATDITIAVQYDATGAVAVQGKLVKVPRYRASYRFDVPGMRVDYDLGDAKQRRVEVVTGTLAWDEDRPGGGLVADYGTATPAPGAQAERLLQFYLTPMAAVKAARVAPEKVKLSTVAGKRVLTVPLPAPLEGAPLTVTLDKDNRPEKVEARPAGRAYEATYANYQDFEPKSSSFLPGKITVKRDGQVVLDLTVTGALSANPYVIFPVPPSVKTTR